MNDLKDLQDMLKMANPSARRGYLFGYYTLKIFKLAFKIAIAYVALHFIIKFW